MLRLPPSRWYLTGFLAPQGGREPEEQRDLLAEEGYEVEVEEESGGMDRESEPKQKNRLPASMGLSVLLPPGPASDVARVRVTWAEYVPEERESETGRRPRKMWRRVRRAPVSLEIPLDARRIANRLKVTGDGVYLTGKLETVGIPERDTRALAIFLVNGREPLGERVSQDERCLFQAELEVTFDAGIVARPNRADGGAEDWDARVADLRR